MTYALSVLIPARNEYCYDVDLLAETVTNVLANSSDATELIVVLDGYSPATLVHHPRVTYIHHSKSIGQRAATNEAARVSRAKYVMKLDAHCALSPNFDTVLMDTFQPDWTVCPAQYNLIAFNWKCKRCGWQKDQGPKPDKCGQCKSQYVKQVKLWFPRDGRENSNGAGGRRNAYLSSWRFDSKLEYQQWGALSQRYADPIHDTMSLLGACWMIERERYHKLNICDTKLGSWGQQGTEVACKSWLSGGELKVNTNVWFAHFFRVGGLHFPYEGGGRKERAMAWSREVWLHNKWPQQVYPLSWLIDRFSPIPDWAPDNPVRIAINEEGALFHSKFSSIPLVGSVTADSTDSLASSASGKQMTVDANGFGGIDSGRYLCGSSNVLPVVANENNVSGVTAGSVVTDNVIQHGNSAASSTGNRLNQPRVHESMGHFDSSLIVQVPVSQFASSANPDPAVERSTANDSRENVNKPMGVDVIHGEHIKHGLTILRKCSIGYLYYTCNSHDIVLELAARANLVKAQNGNELGCVSRERTDFGDWNIVVDREKSGTTMHYQILAGLERMRSDYVFLCESDLLYHESHFQFVPPLDSVFFYNTNVWRIRYSDGHAVRTDGLQQVSGICASRQLLLAHYRRRVQMIEANGGVFDVKRMAYEPGTRGKFGDERVANWESPYPNIDITGHGQTLTTPHFSVDSFRNKRYAAGWQETDEALPGWPQLSNGGLRQLLEELANEPVLR